MKKRNGFTLIELLAVIAIIAIIALIALPTINSLIKETRMKALSNSAYGIIKAGEQYYSKKNLFDAEIKEVTFEFPEAHKTLELNGEAPKSGTMTIDKNGKIEIAISNGKYCATKSYDETKVTVTEDLEQCGVSGSDNNTGNTGEKTLSQLATTETGISIPTCITNKTICTGENKVAIKVNDTDIYNFYVIADDNATVTLIMSENLGDTIAWINASDYTTENNKDETPNTCSFTACNDEGPITAINYLDGLTDEEWSNITPKAYTYSGIGHDGRTRKYEDITRTMRARMITYGEANAIKTANNGTMPAYMYGGTSYWTSTAYASHFYNAWSVKDNGSFGNGNVYVSSNGVRPVIELSK